jgi:hypothetical protein
MAQKKNMKAAKFFLCIALMAYGFFTAQSVFAASLSLSPQSGTYSVGQSFTETVYVSSLDEAMNTAQGTISFPTNKLSVLSISKANSIMTLWVQDPSFSNKDGAINFGGIRVNPGFQGSAGNVITITFQVENPGKADISFLSGSVLANDGKGTNVITGMNNASVSLVAPSPTSPTPPSGLASLSITSTPAVRKGNWYNFNSITFNWNLPANAEGVRYGISNDPGAQLSEGNQGMVSQASYDVSQFPDGMWHFFASYESDGAWSTPSVISFGLDKTPPEQFIIVRQNAGDTLSVRPVFQWAATDKTSGIAYYKAKIGDGDWFDPASIQEGSSYVLPAQSPTDGRTFVVRAYDHAGNFRDASVNFSIGRACTNGSLVCLFLASFSQWGWLVVFILIILLLISYIFIYRLLWWRRRFRAELSGFKDELHRDLGRFEAGGAEKSEKEMEHLESDIEKEVKKIDDFE